MLFACGERIKLTSFLMRDYVPDEKYVIRIPVPDNELRSADKKSIYRRRLFVVPAHKTCRRPGADGQDSSLPAGVALKAIHGNRLSVLQDSRAVNSLQVVQ